MRASATLTIVTYVRPPRRDPDRAAGLVRTGVITRMQACDSKRRYLNQNDARHAAKVVAHSTRRKTTTYKCPFCEGYHVTKLKHGEDEG